MIIALDLGQYLLACHCFDIDLHLAMISMIIRSWRCIVWFRFDVFYAINWYQSTSLNYRYLYNIRIEF